MRQADNQAAAPLNTEPRWPAGYVDVLRQAGAQEKTIPYCIGWVRRFFAENPGRNRRDLSRAEIETFLSGLLRRPEFTNWHIQQARNALELYYEQFRGIALAPRPDVPIPHEDAPPRSATLSSIPIQQTRMEREPTALPECYSEAQSAVKGDICVTGMSHYGRQPAKIPADAQRGFLQESNDRRQWQPGTTNGRADGVEPIPPEMVPTGLAQRGRGGTRPSQNTDGVEPSFAKATAGAPVPPKTGGVNWPVLADKIKECLRVEHYSYRTEQTYLAWIRRYVMFHEWRKPSTLGAGEIRAFLRHLAMDAQVASSTQNQAA